MKELEKDYENLLRQGKAMKPGDKGLIKIKKDVFRKGYKQQK